VRGLLDCPLVYDVGQIGKSADRILGRSQGESSEEPIA
jgi:hypothetical protein